MEHRAIDFVGFCSLILGTLSVLGMGLLSFGPWAQPSAETVRMVLGSSWLGFWMVAILARNVAALLRTQADQIAALERQIGDQRPAA